MNDFYELNTDEFYAYGNLDEDWAFMNFEVVMKDEIDPCPLQEALNLAMERYPYFKTKLSVEKEPERLVLRWNPDPIPVFICDGFVPIDTSELNGHLIAVSRYGKILRIRMSHALSDGVGGKEFVRTLLIFYFRLRYESADPADIRMEIAALSTEKEYDNPFDYIRLPDYRYDLKYRHSFVFAENEVDDSSRKEIRFSIPQDVFLRFSKAQESSVAAVASWLLMRSVFAVSNTEEPVSVAVPYDMRKHLGCLHNNRNCNTTINLRMTRHFLNQDVATQLTALRGELFLQMDGENALFRMQGSYEEWLRASDCQTVQERTAFYHSTDNLDSFPIVSYIGILDTGDYENYYEKADCFAKVSGQAGFLVVVTSNKGMFHFHITSTVKEWRKYLEVILQILNENQIPYTEPVISDC